MDLDLYILKLIACGFWYGEDKSPYKVTDRMKDDRYDVSFLTIREDNNGYLKW